MMQLIYILIFFFSMASANAQFNTLTFTKPKPEYKVKETFPAKNEESRLKLEQHKKPKFLSKKSLRKEIDSLKAVLDDSQPKQNTRSIDFRRVEDSLIEIFKKKVSVPKSTVPTENKPAKSFDTILNGISMPLKNSFAITSGFGIRKHPIFGNVKSHNGIDIKASYENVYAVMDGIVSDVGWDYKGGGNFIKIKHFGRFETAYLHLSDTYYKKGDTVKAGYIIARSGNTGNSTGPHLHFAVREFGQFINPLIFLNDLNKTKKYLAQNYGHNHTTNQ